MKLPRVVHCERADYDVYVGRGGIWGNPFKIGSDGTRDEVIEKYREWIVTQQELMRLLPTLRGKVLACWCRPLKCHADVLIELLDKHTDEQLRNYDNQTKTST